MSLEECDLPGAIRRADTDMTTGSIMRHLIAFSVPLLIGNIFQQLYNTVDSVVVGNFVGKQALAAVGSVAPIINMLIGFFTGFATGAGVLISRYFGAHERENVHKAVQTTIALTIILSVALSVVGVWMTPLMLRAMQTPDDVIVQAEEYLRIYFAGLSGLLLYNSGSGILRAVGDTKRPLYFLVVSAVVNTVLDIVFVAVFRMGIAGVAIATVIAQLASAVLTLMVLTRTAGEYHVTLRELRVDKEMLGKICALGLPAALQLAVTSFSNVFVQSYINRFGSDCMAGWTSYNKIDAFALLPITSISMAATTFVGQNLGAGDPVRARQGTRTALWLSEAATAIILVPLMIFAPQLIRLFNQKPDVCAYGTLFIRLSSPFYLLITVNQVISGALRGAGDSRNCMYITLGSFVVFRQVYLMIVYKLWGTIIPVVMGYPAGWVVCSVIFFFYYRSGRWKKSTVFGET